ncbi:hypothetical protein EII22_09825 [Coriobacteriales bacterium OH1046]|nr:hypothetical protein EII22_09825 [Coriobacteriales bacterium OH1046]
MNSCSNRKDVETVFRVAHLYYDEHYTQEQISKKLFLSRSSISRILMQAREEGIVEIVVHYPYERIRRLEFDFLHKFGMEDVRIIDSDNRTTHDNFTAVTKLAGSYLNSIFTNKTVLGLTYGKSVYGAVHELHPTGFLPYMTVTQVVGATESSNPELDGLDLAHCVSGLYGCNHHYLTVPFMVDDARTCQQLMNRPAVKTTLSIASDSTILLTGIHSKSRWNQYVSCDVLDELDAKKAVGRIAGYFFDIEGNIIDVPEVYDRMIAITTDALLKIPLRIAVVADPSKAEAALGALRGKLVNSLVTNSITAATILSIDDALS